MEFMKQSQITVVGSLNMDLVVETQRIPRQGETVLGKSFTTLSGGKGNNQAVACARLGAEVTLIGCVGEDIYGEQLIQNLKNEGVITEHIIEVPETSTGIASITVNNGENQIIVVPGANHHLTPDNLQDKEEVIKQSDIILVQLEIPLETVIKTIEIAEFHRIPVVLNPAPSMTLPDKLLDKVTYITPNEHELKKMFQEDEVSTQSFEEILARFPEKIVMTKGKKGAYFIDIDGKLVHHPSYPVQVVDTTGAGDSFNAGLVVKLSVGENISEATKFAVAVGALSVTKFGAQHGMPTMKQVKRFMENEL
ncbi:ribokinase [Virgibacillus sp. W0181]|uniref:ribokinase n=1 Tax=Virgibacillus sp. W0181 TaxID=3391581 RepID=UPI003F464925